MRDVNFCRRAWMTLGLVVTVASSAGAANPQFGMVGIAHGQTLRLNVVAFPPSPCNAVIGFLNENGEAVPEQNKTVSLTPGQADFIDLTASVLALKAGQRAELQPVVTLVPQPNPDSPDACAASLEIFTTSSGAIDVASPMPEPDLPNATPQFGMIGLIVGQTLRLNVLAFPPNPCNAVIGFLDKNGVPQPEPDKTVTLSPGQADFVDLPASALALQTGQRAESQPVVTLQPAANGTTACQATAEIFTDSNAQTRTVLYPQPQPD